MLKARLDRAAVSLHAVVAWILLGDFGDRLPLEPRRSGMDNLVDAPSREARYVREQILVTLRDGDLQATGRHSNSPTPLWEHESRRWMMHSGHHSDISSEQWRTGIYNWIHDSLDLSDGQYIDIQVPRFLVVAIWPPKVTEPTNTDGTYTTPYLDLMRRAIVELGISTTCQPKKETVVAWFREQAIDQRPVSDNFARHLAAFVRLPEAQRGGNRRWQVVQGG